MNEPIELAPEGAWLLWGVLVASLGVWAVLAIRLAGGGEAIPWTPRRHVPWNLGGATLVVFCLSSAVMQAIEGATSVDEASASADRSLTLPSALYHSVVLIGIVWLSCLVLRGLSEAKAVDFGLPTSWRQLLCDCAIGAGVFLAALPPVYALQSLLVLVLGLPSSHPTLEQLFSEPDSEMLLSAALVAVIAAPVFEEFAFRVLFQGWLEKLAGKSNRRAACWWPIVLSASCFAVAHQGQGMAPIPLFVLGLGLGYAYRQTHRLAPCLAAHALFNALSLAVALLADTK